MRGRFLYRAILGILLICQSPVCLATDANGTMAEPNVIQQSQQPAGNDSNVADAKISTAAQNEPTKATEKESFDWIKVCSLVVGVAGFIFGIVVLCTRPRVEKHIEREKLKTGEEFRQSKENEEAELFEDRYKKALREEVSWIKMIGSPDIPNLPVHLLDTFVSLRISQTWRSNARFDLKEELGQQERERDFTPEQIMQRAFSNRRMLLIIGDPGSGKTTLMKYYAMCCMSPDHFKKLSFDEPPLPLYFPLRQIHSDGVQIASLPKNLAQWAKEHTLPIDEKWFDNQLSQRQTLVLLDGLDEISDLELRRRVCEWIDNAAAGFSKAKFVATSRWTGYRKSDRIELGFPHLRADVRDFSPDQQEEFLQKWFCAALLEEQRDDGIDRQEWKDKQKQLGLKRAQDVIDFLHEDKNKSVQELAAVPMLLQIIAVVWKEREVLPRGRAELYRIALKYLLDYRDRRRKLDPLLAAEQALRILCPVSL